MPITFTCDECGDAAEADDALAGHTVACPACGHPVTVPVVVDLTPLPPAEPVDPAWPFFDPARRERMRKRRAQSFGGLGPEPVYAGWIALALGVVGIISPWPIRAGLVALPLAAVAFLAFHIPVEAGWFAPDAAHRRPDFAGIISRSVLIFALAGCLAVWGLMVQGREVFDLTGQGPPPPAAPDVQPEVATPLLPPATPWRPSTRFWALPATEPVATPGRPKPTSATAPAVPVVTDVAAERDAAADAAAKADAQLKQQEALTLVHLRALAAAASAYATAHGRYPLTIGDLPHARELRAAVKSPFDVPGQPAVGYVVAAAGQRPGLDAAHLAIVYDAAELADRGATLGVTADGRPLYLDADQIAEQRKQWAGR